MGEVARLSIWFVRDGNETSQLQHDPKKKTSAKVRVKIWRINDNIHHHQDQRDMIRFGLIRGNSSWCPVPATIVSFATASPGTVILHGRSPDRTARWWWRVYECAIPSAHVRLRHTWWWYGFGAAILLPPREAVRRWYDLIRDDMG